ncbi:hypothetical protein [Streptomyces cadmiisoli]|uniref:hypothetical protein n=1 Tax=Streptomyces cadmiisoli TaxID=2184053 RepID=UPI003D72C0CF
MTRATTLEGLDLVTIKGLSKGAVIKGVKIPTTSGTLARTLDGTTLRGDDTAAG